MSKSLKKSKLFINYRNFTAATQEFPSKNLLPDGSLALQVKHLLLLSIQVEHGFRHMLHVILELF